MATGIKDKVAILGMGCAKFGERWDKNPDDLMVEAFAEAIADAGIDRNQIQAAWFGTALESVNVGRSALPLSIALRLPYIPVTRVENYCATGTEAFKFPTSSGTLIRGPTFVPGDRGLLYVESPMTGLTGVGPTALNHLSFVDGRITQLGRWGRSQLPVPPATAARTPQPDDTATAVSPRATHRSSRLNTGFVLAPAVPHSLSKKFRARWCMH